MLQSSLSFLEQSFFLFAYHYLYTCWAEVVFWCGLFYDDGATFFDRKLWVLFLYLDYSFVYFEKHLFF